MRLLRVIFGAAMLLAAGLPAAAAQSGVAWNNTVTVSAAGGHIVGNPDAPIRITEFSSYSCEFCAKFVNQSEGALRIGYLSSGKVSFEVRSLLVSPLDLPLALLVQCGLRDRFFQNHIAMYRRQPRWLGKLSAATRARTARWATGTMAQRNRAIAADLQLYEIMETLGYDRIEADRCLGDDVAANRIRAQSDAAIAMGIGGTPTFAINGTVLNAAHDWLSLRQIIDTTLKASH